MDCYAEREGERLVVIKSVRERERVRRESMESQGVWRVVLVSALVLLVCHTGLVTAGDIVHHDEKAPKKPGCENDFVLVRQALVFPFAISCFRVLSDGFLLYGVFSLKVPYFSPFRVLIFQFIRNYECRFCTIPSLRVFNLCFMS